MRVLNRLFGWYPYNWTTDMEQLARQLIKKHGNLVEVRCEGGHRPMLVFADGYKILAGETKLPMFLYGYSGTRPRYFYLFLREAGFDVSYEDVVEMKGGLVLRCENGRLSFEIGTSSTLHNKRELRRYIRSKIEKEEASLIETPERKDKNNLEFKEPEEHQDAERVLSYIRGYGDVKGEGDIEDIGNAEEVDIEKLEDVGDVEGLIRILNEGNWFAASALGRLGDARAVEPLIQALKDNYYQARDQASFALGKIGDKRAVGPLIEVLKDKKEDWERRASATVALGMIGEPAVNALILALKDEDNEVRWQAAEALGQIRDARAVETLVQALQDYDRIVRNHAAIALGKMGDARAVEPLVQALNDLYGQALWEAIEVLGNMGDTRAVEPLIRALKDDDDNVRRTVAQALGQIGDKRAIEPLDHLLKVQDKDVQEAVKEALEKIK